MEDQTEMMSAGSRLDAFMVDGVDLRTLMEETEASIKEKLSGLKMPDLAEPSLSEQGTSQSLNQETSPDSFTLCSSKETSQKEKVSKIDIMSNLPVSQTDNIDEVTNDIKASETSEMHEVTVETIITAGSERENNLCSLEQEKDSKNRNSSAHETVEASDSNELISAACKNLVSGAVDNCSNVGAQNPDPLHPGQLAESRELTSEDQSHLPGISCNAPGIAESAVDQGSVEQGKPFGMPIISDTQGPSNPTTEAQLSVATDPKSSEVSASAIPAESCTGGSPTAVAKSASQDGPCSELASNKSLNTSSTLAQSDNSSVRSPSNVVVTMAMTSTLPEAIPVKCKSDVTSISGLLPDPAATAVPSSISPDKYKTEVSVSTSSPTKDIDPVVPAGDEVVKTRTEGHLDPFVPGGDEDVQPSTEEQLDQSLQVGAEVVQPSTGHLATEQSAASDFHVPEYQFKKLLGDEERVDPFSNTESEEATNATTVVWDKDIPLAEVDGVQSMSEMSETLEENNAAENLPFIQNKSSSSFEPKATENLSSNDLCMDVDAYASETPEEMIEEDYMFGEGSFIITDVRSLTDSQTDDSSREEDAYSVLQSVHESKGITDNSTTENPSKEDDSMAFPLSSLISNLPVVNKNRISASIGQGLVLKRAASVDQGISAKRLKTSQQFSNIGRNTMLGPFATNNMRIIQGCSGSTVQRQSPSQTTETAGVTVKQEPVEDNMFWDKSSGYSQTAASNIGPTPISRSNPKPIKILQGKKVIQTNQFDAHKKLVMKKVSNPSQTSLGQSHSLSSLSKASVAPMMSTRPVEVVRASGVKPSICKVTLNLPQTMQAPTAAKPMVKIAPKNGLAKVSTGDFESVGIAKITELISRKNPIPVYKPLPVPDLIKNDVNSKVFTCFECGDSYTHMSSLKIHTSRCSMKITYNCDKCLSILYFTNKCQLLGHLRSHLNIALTHAVPIHIKSDAIKIRSVYEDLMGPELFEWYKDAGTVQDTAIANTYTKEVPTAGGQAIKPLSYCKYCHKMFESSKMRREHYTANEGETASIHYECPICPLFLPSKCSLDAHKELHQLLELAEKDGLTFYEPIKYVCPECGLPFGGRKRFMAHLFRECYHFSKRVTFTCSKCSADIGCMEDIKKHLAGNLEQYYKCDMCPMAFKKVQTFMHHFATKHEAISQKGAKIIYRCHICNTLIDDRKFLMSHIEKHCSEIKKNVKYRYHCLLCAQLFPDKSALSAHNHNCNYVMRKKCKLCYALIDNQFSLALHVLRMHTFSKSTSFMEFCTLCGLVCTARKMFLKHICISGGPIKVIGDRRYSVNGPAVDISTKLTNGGTGKNKDQTPGTLSIVFKCSNCQSTKFNSQSEWKSHEILCAALQKQKNEAVKAMMNGTTVEPLPLRKIGQKSKQAPKKSLPKTENEKTSFGRVELTPKQVSCSSIEEQVVFYPCDKCGQIFTRKTKHELHMKEEHGMHACLLCGLIYESISNLKRHITLDHECKKFVYYCYICRKKKIYKSFAEKSSLEKHLEKKHRMNPKSVDPSKMVPELPGLEHEERSTSSSVQGKRKEDESIKAAPVKRLKVEGEVTFNCAKCLFSSESKQEFMEHIPEHKVGNSVQCIECGLCFIVINSLQKHLFMVHKVRDFDAYMEENKIEPVKEDDVQSDTVQDEMQQESSDEEPENPLECRVCYKLFDNEATKTRHMRVHGMAFIKKSTGTRRSLPRKCSVQNNDTTADSQSMMSKHATDIPLKDEEASTSTQPSETEVNVGNVETKEMEAVNATDTTPSVNYEIEQSIDNESAQTGAAEAETTGGVKN